MSKALLLNMRDYKIVKEFATMEEAYTAQDSPEFADFPKHLVDKEDWDLGAVDLCKFHNNLVPEGAAVKRFSDRKAGMARLLRAMNGEVLPVTDERAIKEITRKKRTGKATNVQVIKEKVVSTKRKAKSAKKVPATKKAGTAPVRVSDDTVVKALKAGEARRWIKDSERYKLFEQISKKGEMALTALIKFGDTLKISPERVRACVSVMRRDGTVKVG